MFVSVNFILSGISLVLVSVINYICFHSMTSLSHGAFVPLPNFIPSGGRDFQNTCFIAVVANLRHVLPPVMQFITDQKHTWESFVSFSRTLRDDKQALKFGSGDGNGQHDAAELLGAIIPADPLISGSGVQIEKIREVYCCKHPTNPRREFQALLPLVFPEEQREYRLEELLEHYETPEHLFELMCDRCNRRSEGTFTRRILTGLNGKMVFRFGRYSDTGKRSDRVILDSIIPCRDDSQYRLEAILEHSGSTVLSGHYIIYLLLNGRWEKRNDAEQTFCDETGGPLQYNASNVYLVVYGKVSPAEVAVPIHAKPEQPRVEEPSSPLEKQLLDQALELSLREKGESYVSHSSVSRCEESILFPA